VFFPVVQMHTYCIFMQHYLPVISIAMPKKKDGADLEKCTLEFFKKLFEELGYYVVSARRQWAGTQNGFDVKIVFLDEDDNEWQLFFECKDYDTTLDWGHILQKVLELEASSYNASGFIALSPKKDISNIDDHVEARLRQLVKFPVRYWTPSDDIKEIFSLDPVVYKRIYGQEYPNHSDREVICKRLKSRIDGILKEKKLLRLVNRIEIKETDQLPKEGANYVTNLDNKLNEVLSIDDPDRIEYHKARCEYKIYLEELTDLNNSLRTRLLDWQNDLRKKASRLTKHFIHDTNYTPSKFFSDFFREAENDLIRFLDGEKIHTNHKEKLLQGVIFELAAECPLDWRKKTTHVPDTTEIS